MNEPIQFTTEPPNAKRTLVVARDPDTGKSRSMTLYNVSPEEFIKWLTATVETAAEKRHASSAA
jgi:hypothetical protein